MITFERPLRQYKSNKSVNGFNPKRSRIKMSDLRTQLKNVNDRADELANNPSELTKDALLAQLRSFYDVVKALELESTVAPVVAARAKTVVSAPEPVVEPVAKKVTKEPDPVVVETKSKIEAVVEETPVVEKVAAAVEIALVEVPVVEKAPEVVKKPMVEPEVEALTLEEKPKPKKELIEKAEPVAATGDKKILAGQFNSAPLTDLRSAIPLNEKFGIIRNLFKGNASDFGDAVLKLNNASSAKEVSIYMSQLKQRFDWDERTESYQNFSGYVDRKVMGLAPSNANSDQ